MNMKFPRKIGEDHPEYEIDVEVFEVPEEPRLSSYSRTDLV